MTVAVRGAATVVTAAAVTIAFAVAAAAAVVVAAGATVAVAFADAAIAIDGSDEITRSACHYTLFRLRCCRGFVLIARMDRQGQYGYQAEHDSFQGYFDHGVPR
jgi:hypothetical protein